jgi:hypothetical protein
MDKVQLQDKIKTMGTLDREKILAWVQCLPSNTFKTKPTSHKIGDVLMHPVFQHPYVLLEYKKDKWICGLLTSESNCTEILEPAKSRFFDNNFFTKVIFTAEEPVGTMMGVYENPKHLKHITKELKSIFS